MSEQPMGTTIQGVESKPGIRLGGKSVSLNLMKRSYFRFANRDDFELTAKAPTAKLPTDLTAEQATSIIQLVQHGDLVAGTEPKRNERKRPDKIKPFILFVQQSRSFVSISKRLKELAGMGGNVANSGFSSREILEMIRDSEFDTHSRTDVLNLIQSLLESLPGASRPMDEPGTHEVRPVISEGAKVFKTAPDETVPSVRAGRKATPRDIGKL